MVRLRTVSRRSSVLVPSALACLSRIPTINLTIGCAHGCLYCYTRGYRIYPGEGQVVLYDNILEKLQAELARRRRKPKTIYFSPSSDLFQPIPEALDVAYDMLREILRQGIAVAFLTKGAIPERHMKLLLANRRLVRAQIGLVTRDESVLRIFEPCAAPAETRLAQLRELAAGGIPTQLRVDPILPGVTDDNETLESLCFAASAAGVNEAAASPLFLRPAPLRRLQEAAGLEPVAAKCLAAFHNSERLPIHAERSTVTALPRPQRERIFRRLESIAAGHGIIVKRCACKNPDIATGSCGIAGDRGGGELGNAPRLFDEPKEAPDDERY